MPADHPPGDLPTGNPLSGDQPSRTSLSGDRDRSRLPSPRRRRLLHLSTAGVLAGLAGCSVGPDPTTGSNPGESSPDETPEADSPAGRLAAGGVVAYVRPPEPRTTHAESARVPTGACTGEVLSTEARSRARAIGDAFYALDVTVADVETSRQCTALDTARVAFGRGEPSQALSAGGEETPATDDATTPAGPGDPAALAAALATPPDDGVSVLVGSGATLAAVADTSLAPGGCAVLAPTADGFEVVGSGDPTAWAEGASWTGQRTGSYTIRRGTPQETRVVRIRTATDGPTVFVLGGMHGDEVGGYRAADAVADWTLDAGTVVVLPRANVRAIERGTRTTDGEDGLDLNRQFPLGERPTTPLAREIYDAVVRHDSDVFIDLHSSKGFWGEGHFGQAIFHSDDETLASRLADVVDGLNEAVVPEERHPQYTYEAVQFDGQPARMLVLKVARDLGVPACLHEVTESGLSEETQVAWSTAVAARFLAAYEVRPLEE